MNKNKKGYWRKAYTRSDGTRVAKTWVKNPTKNKKTKSKNSKKYKKKRNNPTSSLTVRRLYLDSQGYEKEYGQYFGVGKPVYEIVDEDSGKYYYIRADNFGEAKEIALEKYG